MITKYRILSLFLFIFFVQSGFGQADFKIQLSDAALELTKNKVTYDPSYFSIDYPNGDVPSDKGVCTDVVIRAYRTLDMKICTLILDYIPKTGDCLKPIKTSTTEGFLI